MAIRKIVSRSIHNSTISTDDIADDAISSGHIADDAVLSSHIEDNIVLPGTDSVTVPKGATADRGTAVAGKFRYNTDDSAFEGYNGTEWAPVGGGGGATGGGSDQVFYENGKTITADYTITTNTNAVSAGPLTVNSGVSVTVPTGSRWVVL